MSPAATRWDRFWHDLEVSADRVAVFRVAFFAVLGVDLWLRLTPDAAYGMADFNVSHLPFLDGALPVPSAAAVVGLALFGGYLAWRMVFGPSRRAIVALAALWWALFLWSQIDSWRHHYLLGILLTYLAFVEWRADKPRGWPIRLLLVQLSIVYTWTVVAKLDPAWFDGRVLASFADESLTRWVSGVSVAFDVAPQLVWQIASAAVVVVELVLVVGLQVRRLWPLTVALGVSLHVVFHLSSLQIGRFSFVLLAIYLLLLPEPWLAALARAGRRLRDLAPAADSPALAWLLVAAAVALALLPLPGAPYAAGLAAAFGAWTLWRARADRLSLGVTHALACAASLVLLAVTDVPRDHWLHRAAIARGLGDTPEALDAARHAVDVDPEHLVAWVAIGELEAERGDLAAANAAFERARALLPGDGELTRLHAATVEAAGADARQVAALFARACEQGDLEACDPQREPTAPQADPGANPCAGRVDECHQLGLQFLTGRGVQSVHDVEAARHFEAACALGHAPACRELAALDLAKGAEDRAASLFQRACEGRDAAACTALGGLYATGRGVARSDSRAASFYRWACDNGDPAGCANLGYLHAEGRGVSADTAEARRLLDRACRAGDAFGCAQLKAVASRPR